MRKRGNKIKQIQLHSKETQGQQKEENQARHKSLPCLNVKIPTLIELRTCRQSMREVILTVMGFRKALRHPSQEGFDNLAFIKLQCFPYLLCPENSLLHVKAED